jgi:hypothetical protein
MSPTVFPEGHIGRSLWGLQRYDHYIIFPAVMMVASFPKKQYIKRTISAVIIDSKLKKD